MLESGQIFPWKHKYSTRKILTYLSTGLLFSRFHFYSLLSFELYPELDQNLERYERSYPDPEKSRPGVWRELRNLRP
jgi:hypothetical protein